MNASGSGDNGKYCGKTLRKPDNADEKDGTDGKDDTDDTEQCGQYGQYYPFVFREEKMGVNIKYSAI